MKKIITILILFCSLSIIAVCGFFSVGTQNNAYIKSLIPEIIKTKLKKTIYAVPTLKVTIANQEQTIKGHKYFFNELVSNIAKNYSISYY